MIEIKLKRIITFYNVETFLIKIFTIITDTMMNKNEKYLLAFYAVVGVMSLLTSVMITQEAVKLEETKTFHKELWTI